MPPYIKDETTTTLVNRLARLRGLNKEDAVRLALEAELKLTQEAIPLRDLSAALRAADPLPPPTGKIADEAFFDDL